MYSNNGGQSNVSFTALLIRLLPFVHPVPLPLSVSPIPPPLVVVCTQSPAYHLPSHSGDDHSLRVVEKRKKFSACDWLIDQCTLVADLLFCIPPISGLIGADRMADRTQCSGRLTERLTDKLNANRRAVWRSLCECHYGVNIMGSFSDG